MVAIGLGALAACSAHAQEPQQPRHPARVLVRFSQDIPEEARGMLRKLVGSFGRQTYDLVPGLERLDVSVGTEKAIAALSNQPGVLYAEPDLWVTKAATTNDPDLPNLWGFQRVDAPTAWDSTTGAGVVVAVIDEGIDVNHPDLAGNIWVNQAEANGTAGVDDDNNGYVDDVHGWDFYNGDASVFDGGPGSEEDSHGTHVAGTIAAVGNDGIGVVGMAYSAKVMSLKFLGPDGGYTSDAVAALDYAVAMGAPISNNSWGGGGASAAMEQALDAALSAGHLFVAAAGNDGKDNDYTVRRGPNLWHQHSYPSDYAHDNVMSVAALDEADQLAWFSNWGDTSVDVAAPGTNILSTLPNGEYGSYNGTSMATPHVSGLAALIWARLVAEGKTPSFADVKSHIMATAELLPALSGKTVSGGLIDAAASQQAVNEPPVVTIASPVPGAVAEVGTDVTFQGSASDPESGDVTASLVWESSIDEVIGTGASFTLNTLSVGSHFITVTATDGGGRTGSETTTLIVEDPTTDDGGGGGNGGGRGKKNK
jgi:subtilisin family serine protease